MVPVGTDWLHEIKHDGYRLLVRKDGDAVSIITRGGYDWTERYPLIVEVRYDLGVHSSLTVKASFAARTVSRILICCIHVGTIALASSTPST